MVSRMNKRRATTLHGNICFRVLFTGIELNHKKELQTAPRHYVEAYMGRLKMANVLSAAHIALYQTETKLELGF
jgi:hypothetical protein